MRPCDGGGRGWPGGGGFRCRGRFATGVRRPSWLATALLLALAAGSGPVHAEGEPPAGGAPPRGPGAPTPPRMTEAEAVAAVAAAARAADAARLADLAGRDEPDPWVVVDELCAAGEHAAAAAFAGASSRPDFERLPAHVAARDGVPEDPTVREAVARAEALLGKRDPTGALAALEGIAPPRASPLDVRAGYARAAAHRALSHVEEAVDGYRRTAAEATSLGWLKAAGLCLHEGGMTAYRASKPATAAELWAEFASVERRRGDRAREAIAFLNLGNARRAAGELRGALESYAASVAAREGSDDRRGLARVHLGMGIAHWELGEYAAARRREEEALEAFRALGDVQGMAQALGNLGLVDSAIGDFRAALDRQERALELRRSAKDALGVARGLGNLGVLYANLGDDAMALEYAEKALAAFDALKDRGGAANALVNIGTLLLEAGHFDLAAASLERAITECEATDDPVGAARASASLGVLLARRGDVAAGIERLEAACARFAAVGAAEEAARARRQIGEALADAGPGAAAETALRDSVAAAERLGNRDLRAEALALLARCLRRAGKPKDALAVARSARGELPLLVRGQSDDQAVSARGRWAALHATGVLAAAQADDAEACLEFCESGRAGALLEMLALRERLTETAVPAEQRAALAAARDAETSARARLRRAGEAEGTERAAARADLLSAQARLHAVVGEIQRVAKRTADVAYPEPVAMAALRACLGEGEALAIYAFAEDRLVAVLVRRDGARIVDLGEGAPVEAACAALSGAIASGDPADALETLRSRLVVPLGLGKDVARLLVSVDGAVSYVPFGALVGGREVAFVPSGTTYALLRDGRDGRGEGTLALGDPDYGGPRDARMVALLRDGGTLSPLPGSREEARAVGTTVLLGKDATEEGLAAALASRPRWRAVHLACHGVLDQERPWLSSLALARGGASDGYLTVQEAFDLRCPADLVVLSACETGRGRVARGEGIVGLVRAFMFAGAPRVLVSLWKVDDEATRALMVRFYELWNPGDGAPGRGAAAALRAAQEHVASQERWRHPRYWAAWVLWGLPE